MATISKRNGIRQKSWQVRIRHSGLPLLIKSFPSKIEAKNWAAETEALIRRDPSLFVYRDCEIKTLRDLFKRYLQEVTPQKKGHQPERHRLRALIRNSIGDISLNKISGAQIAKFRDSRLKQVSSATVLKELTLISSAIEIGKSEWGLEIVIRTNPVSLISKPKAPRPRDRRLEAGELEKLLSACTSPNPWFRSVVLFAIETGMRRGEILSLTWQHVHLDKRYVHLPDTKNGDSRNVPLSPLALELLRELPRNIRGDQVVFPLHYEALKSAWRRACTKASIANLRFHDLRHEATSRFFEKGLNVMEVAAITGHKDLRTLQRYTHLRAEDLALKLG